MTPTYMFKKFIRKVVNINLNSKKNYFYFQMTQTYMFRKFIRDRLKRTDDKFSLLSQSGLKISMIFIFYNCLLLYSISHLSLIQV